MLPGILNQLGADSLTHLKRLASGVANASSHAVNVADGNLADNDDDDDDEVQIQFGVSAPGFGIQGFFDLGIRFRDTF